MKRLDNGILAAAVAAAALVSGCVHKSEEPALTGPSTFATSLNVTASPDILSLGPGSSTAGESSTIAVQVNKADGAAVPAGTTVRLQVMVGPNAQDCGQLTQRVLQIPSSGRATTTFTAPGFPLPLPACLNFAAGSSVSIAATLEGSDFQTVTVPIRMIQQGVILPPAGTPTPQFSFFPVSPTVGASVQFDARLSCAGETANGACAPTSGTIVSYQWNFGDGGTASGPVVYHTYSISQSYSVTLIVTNDAGISAGTSQSVAVTLGEPVPSFTFAPDAGTAHTVNFDASGSKVAPGASVKTYTWDFGDSTPTVTTTSAVISHTYAPALAGSNVPVTLTITDSSNRTGSKSVFVTVP